MVMINVSETNQSRMEVSLNEQHKLKIFSSKYRSKGRVLTQANLSMDRKQSSINAYVSYNAYFVTSRKLQV